MARSEFYQCTAAWLGSVQEQSSNHDCCESNRDEEENDRRGRQRNETQHGALVSLAADYLSNGNQMLRVSIFPRQATR